MLNWVNIGAALGIVSAAASLIMVFLFYRGYQLLQEPPKVDSKEVMRQILKEEPARVLQMKSVEARFTNEANKKISRSFLENSPLAAVLQWLDDDTIEYLEEHPEALPGVLKKWVPLLTAAKPFLDMFLEQLQQQQNASQGQSQYNL
jgi:hypothetical protein